MQIPIADHWSQNLARFFPKAIEFIGEYAERASFTRALQLRREARMVSLVMGATVMGTMYFLWARCAQHGGNPVAGVWFASLYEVTGLYFYDPPQRK